MAKKPPDWTRMSSRQSEGKTIIVPDQSDPNKGGDDAQWDPRGWNMRPSQYGMINAPKKGGWLSSFRGGDFKSSTSVQKLWEKFTMLPIVTVAFLIADIILLVLFLRYVLS